MTLWKVRHRYTGRHTYFQYHTENNKNIFIIENLSKDRDEYMVY